MDHVTTTQLFGALLFTGSVTALCWRLMGARQGEEHQPTPITLDEATIELQFFGHELPQAGQEATIVVDYDQLMGVETSQPSTGGLKCGTPQVASSPALPPPLPRLDLPRAEEITHRQVLTVIHGDLMVDLPAKTQQVRGDARDEIEVEHADMDDEPSIVVDYAALGLEADGDRAIVLDPTLDDGQEAMAVTVNDVISLTKREPEQMTLGL